MIFVSYGSHVVERFRVSDTYTLPYALEPLRRIVDEENSNLIKTYPLNKVYFIKHIKSKLRHLIIWCFEQ